MIFISISVKGQLQYNGVKLISSSQTVPVGKVWKVESILPNQFEVQNIGVSGARILVNGGSIYLVDRSGIPTSNNTFLPSMMPLWLPENTTLAPSSGVLYISVIEFNVVP